MTRPWRIGPDAAPYRSGSCERIRERWLPCHKALRPKIYRVGHGKLRPRVRVRCSMMCEHEGGRGGRDEQGEGRAYWAERAIGEEGRGREGNKRGTK